MDVILLNALSTRKHYRTLRGSVPAELYDSKTLWVLDAFGKYFDAFETRTEIVEHEILAWLKTRGIKAEEFASASLIIQHALKPQPKEAVDNILSNLIEQDFSGRAASIISRYQGGEEIEVTQELFTLASRAHREMATVGDAGWANGDIAEYIMNERDDAGLFFKSFPVLMQNLKGIREGHNFAFAADTDAGKTSLMMRCVADFAEQAKDRQQPILYLVNEGTAEALTPRFYGTVLGKNNTELLELHHAGKLIPEYERIVGFKEHVRFVNIHGWTLGKVARYISNARPHGVVTDMTGRIRINSGNSNDIQQLEDVWNGMRELAATESFWHGGSAQISMEGKDQWYPPLSALQNSKTGIQTTLDLAIWMGNLNPQTSPEFAQVRGISTPKNKLVREGRPAHSKFQMEFKPERNIWTGGAE